MARGDADSHYRAKYDVTAAGSDRVFRTIRANGKATKTCRQGIAFEFFLNKTIQYSCHIDDTTCATDVSYDMIYRTGSPKRARHWHFVHEARVNMGRNFRREHAHEVMLNLNEGVLTTEATSRIKRILVTSSKRTERITSIARILQTLIRWYPGRFRYCTRKYRITPWGNTVPRTPIPSTGHPQGDRPKGNTTVIWFRRVGEM